MALLIKLTYRGVAMVKGRNLFFAFLAWGFVDLTWAAESIRSQSPVTNEYLCQADMGERLVGRWSVRDSEGAEVKESGVVDARILADNAQASDFKDPRELQTQLELKSLRKRDAQKNVAGQILSIDSRYLLHRFPKIILSLPQKGDPDCSQTSKECRVSFRFQSEKTAQRELTLSASSRDPRGGNLKWEIYGRLIFESPSPTHTGPELRIHYTLEKSIPKIESLLVDGMMIRPAELIYGDLGEISANELRSFGTFSEPIEAIEAKLSCDPLEQPKGGSK